MDPVFETLVQQTLLFSTGVLLVALLRPLLLRALGAGAAYLSWLTVPLLMASPWLSRLPWPEVAPVLPAEPQTALAAAVAQALPAAQAAAASSPAAAVTWLAAWAAGALLLAAGLVVVQRRYLTQLHRVPDGSWLAPAGASPAVVGVWPQRLVLPEDFEQRFDEPARRLVLAHEAVHARRHDNAWNLLGAALLCLQWFNPLAWWAWRRLRSDQELACDAAVLNAQAAPAPLAAYAHAMLAAHHTGWPPALASGWAMRHPLVERVRLLARHRAPPRWGHWGAALLVLGLGGGAAMLARAAQEPWPAAQGQSMVFELTQQLGGSNWTRRTLTLPVRPNMLGGPSGITLNAMQTGWCLGVVLHTFDDGSLRPTGQVLDETCQTALGDWRELKVNGSVAQFVATTAKGPLQAQLSARWANPGDPALPALMKADLDSAPTLSPEQQRLQTRQREQMAEAHRQQQALDRAWREARESQAPR